LLLLGPRPSGGKKGKEGRERRRIRGGKQPAPKRSGGGVPFPHVHFLPTLFGRKKKRKKREKREGREKRGEENGGKPTS